MNISMLTGFTALFCATIGPVLIAPASAQQNGTQPVEDSTPWNPEPVPAQTVFDYGAETEPTLTCAPNKYCGLALEAGETVQSTAANEDHWSVTATVYGAGKLAKPVILVTPWAPGLSDELTITTTTTNQQPRRYKVKLMSDTDKWTQLATYRYPTVQ